MAEVRQENVEAGGAATGADGGGLASVRRSPTDGGEPPRSKERGTERLFNPLIELALARVREFLREPEVVFWVFLFPVLLAFALGIAFRNTGPEKVFVAVESTQASGADAAANALAERLRGSEEITVQVLSAEESARALRSGKVALVVRPNVVNSGGEQFTYRYDPTRPESRATRLLVDDHLQRSMGRTDVTRAGEERVSEQGSRYIDFLIPGLLGLNLMGSGLWGVGFAIVTARLRKLLKRLAATPMRRTHYLLSFVVSRMIFLLLEVSLVLLFARVVFGYRIQGSYLSMATLLLVGALTFAGIGLLVAARPRTIEGVSGLMNLAMMPMWLLSGTFFSAERFPAFLQPFIKVLPLTALNDGLRAVMNEGAPLSACWPGLCILLGWCLVSFVLALRLFRWQ